MSEKVDLKRELDTYRARRDELRLLEVPPMRYLAVDGTGDPNGPAFAPAVETLYPVAYAMKIGSKRRGRDYVVPPLEGLWWADDVAAFTHQRDKTRWRWTLLLLVPDWLDDHDVAAAVAAVAAKARPTRLDDLRVEELHEGLCLQTLHVGSFDDEGPVLDRMHHEAAPGRGLRLTGRHHEVYLSDVRRTPPARRRTILRQPVARVVDPGSPTGQLRSPGGRRPGS